MTINNTLKFTYKFAIAIKTAQQHWQTPFSVILWGIKADNDFI